MIDKFEKYLFRWLPRSVNIYLWTLSGPGDCFFISSKKRSSSKTARFVLAPCYLYFSPCIFSLSLSVGLLALLTDAKNLLNASTFIQSSAIFLPSPIIGQGFFLLVIANKVVKKCPKAFAPPLASLVLRAL